MHLASIVGESQNKNWVTDISNLGIKKSEECYTISVTIPAKLISIFTEFAETKAIYINSIYGTHPPIFLFMAITLFTKPNVIWFDKSRSTIFNKMVE